MNRSIKAIFESIVAPFRSLREQLEEEQPSDVEDNGFDVSEWVGFIGASVWLVASFGKVRWENNDRRAMGTGLLLMAGVVLLGWLALRQLVQS